MRPFPALGVLVAALAVTAPSAAIAPIPGGRPVIAGPDGGAPHLSASVRFEPVDERNVVVDLNIDFARDAKLPPIDTISFCHETPTAVEASTDDGRPLDARITKAPGVAVTLPRAGEPQPAGLRLRFSQPAPPVQRYGWRYAVTEAQPSLSVFQVTHDVVVTVMVPEGRELPGFDCRAIEIAGEGRNACTRTTPRNLGKVPLVLPAPLDLLGMALMILTTGAGVYGFERMRRKRAAEHVEHARAIAPIEQPQQDRPGGAYREPPARAVLTPEGDATEALAALNARARWIAMAAIGSTAAVAVLAAERTPWPMPSVTAAWIALVGFVGALLVERS